MLALDQRTSFRRMIDPQNPESVTDSRIIQEKAEIIDALLDQSSGILVDPDYGLKAYANRTKPYLLTIEKAQYKEINGERMTELQYTVEELKNLGASGIKLFIYYNHEHSTAAFQRTVAKKVLDSCRVLALPFFLEIVTYGEEGPKSKYILNAINDFFDQNILPDVFKLEFSGDSKSCREITNSLRDTPWILLTRGVEFKLFKKGLQVAVDQGCSGFLAGRSLWQEAIGKSGDERLDFFKTVSSRRLEEICQIVLGNK